MLSYCHLFKGEANVRVFREELIQKHCLKLNVSSIYNYNCKKMQKVYISIVKNLSDPSPPPHPPRRLKWMQDATFLEKHTSV